MTAVGTKTEQTARAPRAAEARRAVPDRHEVVVERARAPASAGPAPRAPEVEVPEVEVPEVEAPKVEGSGVEASKGPAKAESPFALLAAPFAPEAVSWRVGSTNADKTRGLALAYLDARDVMERLDEVVGPGGWQNDYTHAGDKTVCRIGVRVGDEWVWKADGAGDTDVEAAKGALSDAFKRAAVRWGIGRYLYDLPARWVDLEKQGRTSAIAPRAVAQLQADLRRRAAADAAARVPEAAREGRAEGAEVVGAKVAVAEVAKAQAVKASPAKAEAAEAKPEAPARAAPAPASRRDHSRAAEAMIAQVREARSIRALVAWSNQDATIGALAALPRDLAEEVEREYYARKDALDPRRAAA